MKIAFVYPSFQHHAQSNPELTELFKQSKVKRFLGSPSAGIPILAELTPKQHQVQFFDDRIEEIPFDEYFDLIAMPVFTPAACRAMEIADKFRERGVKVVVGGIFSSIMPEEMASHVDAVCIGSGERVWPLILADAEANTLKRVYKSTDNGFILWRQAPRYDLYFAKENPEKPYTIDGEEVAAYSFYPLVLHRGCSFSCLACVIPEYMGRNIQFMPIANIALSLDALRAGGKARSVQIADDTLTLPNRTTERHFQSVLKIWNGVRPWAANLGCSPYQILSGNAHFFKWMRHLNIHSLYMVHGFDPVSRAAFAAKPNVRNFQRLVDAVHRAHDNGIKVLASLLVGHDEEDESVFDQVLEYALKTDIYAAEFVILTPYPGTPIWRKLNAEGRIITREWSKYNDANPTFQPKNMTPERLRDGYIYLWKEFTRNRKNMETQI